MTRPKKPRRITLGSYTVSACGPGPDAEGRWRWRLEWYPEGENGAQRTRSIGRLAARDVEAEAMRVRQLIEAGDVGRPRRPKPGEVTTWAILLRLWLAAQTRESKATGRPQPRTIELYTRMVGLLLWATGDRTLPTGPRALAAQAVAIRDKLLRQPGSDTGLAPSTTRVAVVVASLAWRWGVMEELVAPLQWIAPRIEMPPVERHIPTREQAAAVLAEIERRLGTTRGNWRPAYDWPVVAYRIHWAAAPRVGELAQLRRCDVDLERGAIRVGVVAGDAKTGPRWSRIDRGAAEALGAMLAARDAAGDTVGPNDCVWPVAPLSLKKTWWIFHVSPAIAALGLPRWTPHAVRHALSDDMAEQAVDEVTQRGQIGNSKGVREAYYRRPIDKKMAAVVENRTLDAAGPDVIILDKARNRQP